MASASAARELDVQVAAKHLRRLTLLQSLELGQAVRVLLHHCAADAKALLAVVELVVAGLLAALDTAMVVVVVQVQALVRVVGVVLVMARVAA